MKILVTGGGGFLGGALVRRLVSEGYEVRSFSRGVYPELAGLGVEQVRGDLADRGAVEEACTGCDLVFHVAAKAGIWGPYSQFYSANVIGTQNVVEACRKLGISRLIHTSSPSVVLEGRDMNGVDESVPYPNHYKAAYPKTKARAERFVLASNSDELATIALRPHLIWGPGDTTFVPRIIARSDRLKQIGKVDKLVDFTYIDDVVQAHIDAMNRLAAGAPCAGRAYFISQDSPMGVWAFFNRVLEAAGKKPIRGTVHPKIAYAAGWVCEILFTTLPVLGEPPITRYLAEELSVAHWFDISAAKRDLGFRPRLTMEQGFDRLRKWFDHQSDAGKPGLD